MESENVEIPLVSFCMSTYKRPELLKKQLLLLLQQDYKVFNIVVSDNDVEMSAKSIIEEINDSRIKYFANSANLGMVNSFNKSIERAVTKYVIMITDDDPVEKNMLVDLVELIKHYPGFSIYCGFKRPGKADEEIEKINKDEFAIEMLDPQKTSHIFWTNCIINRQDLITCGGMPEYGSPHLADHAMMALSGSVNGGIIMNKIYSTHYVHDTNFSRLNLDSYLRGCTGFYQHTSNFFTHHKNKIKIEKIVIKHLHKWFIVMSFSLRHFYYKINDEKRIAEINEFSNEILKLNYMRGVSVKYLFKKIIFKIKTIIKFI